MHRPVLQVGVDITRLGIVMTLSKWTKTEHAGLRPSPQPAFSPDVSQQLQRLGKAGRHTASYFPLPLP